MNRVEKTIDSLNSNIRLDKAIGIYFTEFTRSAAQKLIKQNRVFVDDVIRDKNYIVNEGQLISIDVPSAINTETKPENIPLDIRYEDDDILVVNKPKGMVVHPAPGNYQGTLVNALLGYCGDSLSGINGVIRPGIVHRLDKDTSGLLIVAKNDYSHKILAEQIKIHSFKRQYEAIVYGNVKNDKGTINFPIGRHPKERKKMAVTFKNSREAVTHFQVIERYERFTHVKLILETGRTHQIRVHMSYLGHPVVGDEVYGPKNKFNMLKGQCLHAGLIGFIHPVTGKNIEIYSELPKYFINFIKLLKFNS